MFFRCPPCFDSQFRPSFATKPSCLYLLYSIYSFMHPTGVRIDVCCFSSSLILWFRLHTAYVSSALFIVSFHCFLLMLATLSDSLYSQMPCSHLIKALCLAQYVPHRQRQTNERQKQRKHCECVWRQQTNKPCSVRR